MKKPRIFLVFILLIALSLSLTSCKLLQKIARTPEYVSNTFVQYKNETNSLSFFFSLLDEDKNEISAKVTVDYTVKNKNGEVLYTGSQALTKSNFSTWYSDKDFFLGAEIEIPVSDIPGWETSQGILSYVITMVNGSYFVGDVDIYEGAPLISSEFKTLTYSGEGPAYIKDINLPYGTYNVIFTHKGSENFIAEFNNVLAVNEIGNTSYVYQIKPDNGTYSYDPTTPLQNGYINITNADGYWTVTIEKIG